MQRHIENLNDIEIGDNMSDVDWVGQVLDGIFAVAGSAILSYIILLMMQLYMRWSIVGM